jgi:hypothetical protein
VLKTGFFAMEGKKLRKIKIKPLSINKAWKGRRFKTKEHVNYCKVHYYLHHVVII